MYGGCLRLPEFLTHDFSRCVKWIGLFLPAANTFDFLKKDNTGKNACTTKS